MKIRNNKVSMPHAPPQAILSYSGHISNFRETKLLPKPVAHSELLPDMERSVIAHPYSYIAVNEDKPCCDRCCDDVCESKTWKSLICCCCCYYLFYDD